MEHPIQNLMNIAMQNLHEMIDVNTIVGSPIHAGNGSTIIPVSKVGFGFSAGGTEFSSEGIHGKRFPFGGGSGGGVSISPVAFLLINQDGVQLLHLQEKTHLIDKVIDAVPQVIEKVQEMMSGEDMLNPPPHTEDTLGMNSDTPIE